MINALLNEIASRGDKGAVVPVSWFEDLKHEMDDLKSEKNHAFSDWMAGSMTLPEAPGFEPRALICIVTPSPKVTLRFNDRGRQTDCIVPPYYTDECTIGGKVLDYINAFLAPRGFMAAETGLLPEKLLAVRAGLALYGRNNVTYNEEFGSHIRLLSYVSDLPCVDGPWFPSRRMEACAHCRACVDACPTNAIDLDRTVIDAHICLTLKNELPGIFPDGLPKDAHNSLVGCMKCQDCCPGNARKTNEITTGATFTEAETAEILSHKDSQPYSAPLAAKLEAAGINPDFWPLLPRNLAVLLR
ncbi:MAG: epoxyqueuosine reductase [Clostridiales bacterium]|nr:epoxyqueuosine reductase [Clostridiales bacterium]